MSKLRIEATPLYLARKAIDEAREEVEAVMDIWCESDDDDFPYGDYDLELRPDSGSLGFEAVFEFSEGISDKTHDAARFEKRLHDVLVKHGVATVTVIGNYHDQAGPEEFEE